MGIEKGPFNQEVTEEEKKDDITGNKKISEGARLRQLQEMKRTGAKKIEDLPGENN